MKTNNDAHLIPKSYSYKNRPKVHYQENLPTRRATYNSGHRNDQEFKTEFQVPISHNHVPFKRKVNAPTRPTPQCKFTPLDFTKNRGKSVHGTDYTCGKKKNPLGKTQSSQMYSKVSKAIKTSIEMSCSADKLDDIHVDAIDGKTKPIQLDHRHQIAYRSHSTITWEDVPYSITPQSSLSHNFKTTKSASINSLVSEKVIGAGFGDNDSDGKAVKSRIKSLKLRDFFVLMRNLGAPR